MDRFADIAGIKPAVVQELLRSRGWKLVGSSDTIAVYQRHGYELEVPLHEHYADYSRRMTELVEPLAKLESMSVHALLDELSRPPCDVLALRIQSDLAATGTLPLNDAIRFREGAKNLILSAAHSVIAPQAYFPRLGRAEALELVAGVHEGQTQRGSFVARFLVPVAPKVGELELGEPFGRRVTTRLMQALDRVCRVRSLGSYDELLEMQKLGVSGNLLSALDSMQPPGGSGAIELCMSWARNRPVPETASSVRFPSEALVGLGAVAEAMRSRAETRGFEMQGYVAKLARPPGESGGEGDVVIVSATADTPDLRSVSVHLDADSYQDAIRAHDCGHLVRVVGSLVKDGRRWRLKRVSGLEVVPDGDAE